MEFSKIIKIRKEKAALRRGRQFLRPISGDGQNFGLPVMLGSQIRSIIPWSRILSDTEILLAINTDTEQAKIAWVTIDASLHKLNDFLICIYSTDAGQIGKQVNCEAKNGLSVKLTVPAAGLVIFE